MDPWLGSYQNVPLDGSEAYLTEHQREQLENFRQHHHGGVWFSLQQRWTQVSEQTSLLLRRARGDHRDYEPLQPFTNALRNRKVRIALVSLAHGFVLYPNKIVEPPGSHARMGIPSPLSANT